MESTTARYSDSKVLELTKQKSQGSLKYLRYLLKSAGRLETREKFTDEHLKLYKDAIDIRNKTKCSWKSAFEHVGVSEVNGTDEEITELKKKMENLNKKIDVLITENTQFSLRLRSLEFACYNAQSPSNL